MRAAKNERVDFFPLNILTLEQHYLHILLLPLIQPNLPTTTTTATNAIYTKISKREICY